MSALFSFGQHDALVVIQGRLMTSTLWEIGQSVQEPLTLGGGVADLHRHQGAPGEVVDRTGVAQAGSAALTAAARVADPSAIVWRGDPHLPPEEQGVKILGIPLGHPSKMRSQLVALTVKHEHLISNILQKQDLQCVWILLLYCASGRTNYSLRVVHPKLTDAFAAQHDASMHKSLSQLVSVDPSSMYWDVASLPLIRGSIGLLTRVDLAASARFQLGGVWR